MSCGPRLDAPGALADLMVRGIERSLLFQQDHDRQDLLARLGTLVNLWGRQSLGTLLR